MTIILSPTGEHKVSTHDGLWMSAGDAAKVTGWTLKPEGMCLAERCVRRRQRDPEDDRLLNAELTEHDRRDRAPQRDRQRHVHQAEPRKLEQEGEILGLDQHAEQHDRSAGQADSNQH